MLPVATSGQSVVARVRGAALRAASAALQSPIASESDPAQSPLSAAAAATRPATPERTRRHLLRAGDTGMHSRDLLDPAAPAE